MMLNLKLSKHIRPFLFFFLLLCSSFLYGQASSIEVDEKLLQIDHQKNIILINQSIASINALWEEGDITEIHIPSEGEFTLANPVTSFQIGIPYDVQSTTEVAYQLFFTSLPIIHIQTEEEIEDEPRKLGTFYMSESNGNVIDDTIGVEYRGAWTQTLDKKSLRIEFWEDVEGIDNKNVELLGMRSDDDWILQAMFNEPLRFNDMVSFKLWMKMDTLYYYDEKPNAINGVRTQYTELFINGEYRGVYGLGEKIDRKQLKLKKYKEDNKKVRGELYKAKKRRLVTKFEEVSNYDNSSDMWEGYQVKYPKAKDTINWSKLYELVDFVVNSSDQFFYDTYQENIVVDNMINYYIFINVTYAADNSSKNYYMAKFKHNEPYFYVPWDLDGTFGVWWDGTNHHKTDIILTNGLYDRLIKDCSPNGFVDQLKNRWNELRSNKTISYDSITQWFDDYVNILDENGVYDREELAWPSYIYPDEQMEYMKTWLAERLDVLDQYFSLDCEALNVEEDDLIKMVLYPNPANTTLTVESMINDKYNVYNSEGKIVLKGTIEMGGANTIDVAHLQKGVYILKTQGGETHRFIKE